MCLYSPLKSPAQNRRKFEWPSSTGREQSHRTSGPNIVEWPIGSIPKRSPDRPLKMKLALCKTIAFLILVTTIFAASPALPAKSDVAIATYNLHGFSKSSKYLNDCLKSHGGIWFVQEHWLPESRLHMFQELDAQFFARSGMEDAVSSGVYRGRPFGGESICWSPNLSQFISPVFNFKHKRIVAVELKTEDSQYLLISIYMPFYNASRREVPHLIPPTTVSCFCVF